MVQIYTKIANTTQNYIFFLLRFLPQKKKMLNFYLGTIFFQQRSY